MVTLSHKSCDISHTSTTWPELHDWLAHSIYKTWLEIIKQVPLVRAWHLIWPTIAGHSIAFRLRTSFQCGQAIVYEYWPGVSCHQYRQAVHTARTAKMGCLLDSKPHHLSQLTMPTTSIHVLWVLHQLLQYPHCDGWTSSRSAGSKLHWCCFSDLVFFRTSFP